MAKQKVIREITIRVCDECGAENPTGECGICEKEKCLSHLAYQLELYRYSDRAHIAGYRSYVCQQCAELVAMFGQMLDAMLADKLKV